MDEVNEGIIEKPKTLFHDPIYTRQFIKRIIMPIKKACPEDFIITNMEFILTDGEQTAAFAYTRAEP